MSFGRKDLKKMQFSCCCCFGGGSLLLKVHGEDEACKWSGFYYQSAFICGHIILDAIVVSKEIKLYPLLLVINWFRQFCWGKGMKATSVSRAVGKVGMTMSWCPIWAPLFLLFLPFTLFCLGVLLLLLHFGLFGERRYAALNLHWHGSWLLRTWEPWGSWMTHVFQTLDITVSW